MEYPFVEIKHEVLSYRQDNYLQVMASDRPNILMEDAAHEASTNMENHQEATLLKQEPEWPISVHFIVF